MCWKQFGYLSCTVCHMQSYSSTMNMQVLVSEIRNLYDFYLDVIMASVWLAQTIIVIMNGTVRMAVMSRTVQSSIVKR